MIINILAYPISFGYLCLVLNWYKTSVGHQSCNPVDEVVLWFTYN